MFIACMVCGLRAPLRPTDALNPEGWRYDTSHGWRCEPCSKLENVDAPPRRRSGRPLKGSQ